MDIKNTTRGTLSYVKKVYFIGIGGSGMCPLAEILQSKGYEVSGSDHYLSDTLETMIKKGTKVHLSHQEENIEIENPGLVVYSAAIKKDNPEMVAAMKRNLPIMERSQLQGEVTSWYKNAIAVSGTHGKTSTTSMITQIFTQAGEDPTAIIGGKLPFIGGNSRIGRSEYIICEACEYVDSFLNLQPAISVILNIDEDHLDYFKTLDNIVTSFGRFAGQTTRKIFVNGDDANSLRAVEGARVPVVTFGFGKGNTYRAEETPSENPACGSYSLIKDGQIIAEIKLNVPGRHNVYNSLAAGAVAHYCGISGKSIAKSLFEFSGAHRRFEVLGKPGGITVADDFAHHPTEICATLTAAMAMKFKRVIAVFEPHTFSRTATHLEEFARALSIADKVVLTPILAVREQNTYGIHSEDLAKKIANCTCLSGYEEIARFIKEIARDGDIVITMGGGNVYKCAHLIIENLADQ